MEQMTYEEAVKIWRNGLGGFAQKTDNPDKLKGAMDLIKERVDFISDIGMDFIGYAHLNELNNLIFLYKASKIVWEKQEEDRRILKERFSESVQEFYSICMK